MAIIRPAAKEARYKTSDTKNTSVEYESDDNIDDNIDYSNEFVYDDDAIQILSKTLNISFDLADKFRRCLSKDKWDKDTRNQFNDLTKKIKNKQKKLCSKN